MWIERGWRTCLFVAERRTTGPRGEHAEADAADEAHKVGCYSQGAGSVLHLEARELLPWRSRQTVGVLSLLPKP